MKRTILSLLLLLPACGGLPRDPNSTLKRIEESRLLTVGIVGGMQSAPATQRLLRAIQQRTHARVQTSQAAAETLLASLADGKIDLVIGPFAKNSPWKTEVAFGPPLLAVHAESEANPIELRAAMRNGENRWIMLVESASRSVSDEARAR